MPSGVTSLTVVPSGSSSKLVTLSVKSTVPPFSISSFSTVGSYLSASEASSDGSSQGLSEGSSVSLGQVIFQIFE